MLVSAGMLAQALSTSVAAMAPKRLQGAGVVAALGAAALAGSINRGMHSFCETSSSAGRRPLVASALQWAREQSGKKGLAGSRSFGIWKDQAGGRV